MKRDITVYIRDILESIEKIQNHIHGISEEDFYENVTIQDAVVRRLEIIGEAVKNIPNEFLKSFPHIPWRSIKGSRDVLIHEYFGVNMGRVWNTATKDLKELRSVCEEMLRHTQKK